MSGAPQKLDSSSVPGGSDLGRVGGQRAELPIGADVNGYDDHLAHSGRAAGDAAEWPAVAGRRKSCTYEVD